MRQLHSCDTDAIMLTVASLHALLGMCLVVETSSLDSETRKVGCLAGITRGHNFSILFTRKISDAWISISIRAHTAELPFRLGLYLVQMGSRHLATTLRTNNHLVTTKWPIY